MFSFHISRIQTIRNLGIFIGVFLLLGNCDVSAVQVECRTNSSQSVNYCQAPISSSTPGFISVISQENDSNCLLNVNFWLYFEAPDKHYVWVSWGCSGVFEVTAQPVWSAWGSWGECDEACGDGKRTRKRRCSTGRDLDCSTDGQGGMQEVVCNEGPCTRGASSPPLCGFSPSGYRVFGGKAASDCQFPWMVMTHNIRKAEGHNRCGGTIVDQTHIITAAHCVSTYDTRLHKVVADPIEDLVVYSGSSKMPINNATDPAMLRGLIQRPVASVKIHEDYVASSLANDIAVITLTTPILYDRCHVPVCMIGDHMSVYKADQCKTMGWGKTEDSGAGSSKLEWTGIKVVDKSVCSYTYGVWYLPKCFCAGGNGHDACGGDSGGPVVCKGPSNRYYQFGIVSSGFKGLCGRLPGQYTSIEEYLKWLQTQLE